MLSAERRYDVLSLFMTSSKRRMFFKSITMMIHCTGESAELPPGGGAIILARLRSEGGQVKSFSFFHWCLLVCERRREVGGQTEKREIRHFN